MPIRTMFAVGAAWNVAVGLLALVAPDWTASQFYGPAAVTDDPLARMASADFAGCVIVFGIGFAIVALDPRRNHGIVLLGVLGKLGVVVGFSYRVLTGHATPLLFVPVAVDLAFAVVFAWFLVACRRWY